MNYANWLPTTGGLISPHCPNRTRSSGAFRLQSFASRYNLHDAPQTCSFTDQTASMPPHRFWQGWNCIKKFRIWASEEASTHTKKS